MSCASWQTSRRSKPQIWSGNSQSGSILSDTSLSTAGIDTPGRSSRRGGGRERNEIREEGSDDHSDDDSDDERPGAYAVSRRDIITRIGPYSEWDPTDHDTNGDCEYDVQHHGEASVTGHASDLNTTLETNP